jgi:hypothetical protein
LHGLSTDTPFKDGGLKNPLHDAYQALIYLNAVRLDFFQDQITRRDNPVRPPAVWSRRRSGLRLFDLNRLFSE